MPSRCLNSLSFTRDEVMETTVGQLAMASKRKSSPAEILSRGSLI
jgi:hypothetical protein